MMIEFTRIFSDHLIFQQFPCQSAYSRLIGALHGFVREFST